MILTSAGLFDHEILRAVFLARLIDVDSNFGMLASLVSRYLYSRVLADRAGNNEFVKAIRRTAEFLSHKTGKHSEQLPDKYIQGLCTLATIRRNTFAVLGDLKAAHEPTAHQPHEDSRHLLTAAAYTGKIELVTDLLEKKVDVNTESRYLGKPLQAAAYGGYPDVVLLLLEQGADINDGELPSRYNEEEVLGSIFCFTPLQAASLAGHEHLARLLVKSERSCKNSGKDYALAIMMAAQGGHPRLVQFLMENGKISQPSRLRELLLSRACIYGHEPVARMMLDNGADINIKDEITMTPLHLAAHHGHEQVVRLLLARGANQHYEPLYNGPIHEAAKLGHERIARILVDHGADINGGWPAPLAAAAFLGQAHMVRFFLDRGADIAAPNCGKIALRNAAFKGYESVVRMLVESGVNMEGSGGLADPMLEAMCGGHDHVVKCLLELGAAKLDPLKSRYADKFASGEYPKRPAGLSGLE